MKYLSVDDWLNEIEGFALRLERLYEDIGSLPDRDRDLVLSWIHGAFDAAREPDAATPTLCPNGHPLTRRENDTNSWCATCGWFPDVTSESQ